MLLKMSSAFGLIAPCIQALGSSILPCLVLTKVALASLERNADQMPLVAHYIHLCFHARMSDESHLAAQPEL